MWLGYSRPRLKSPSTWAWSGPDDAITIAIWASPLRGRGAITVVTAWSGNHRDDPLITGGPCQWTPGASTQFCHWGQPSSPSPCGAPGSAGPLTVHTVTESGLFRSCSDTCRHNDDDPTNLSPSTPSTRPSEAPRRPQVPGCPSRATFPSPARPVLTS
jgi:hypothetical protein